MLDPVRNALRHDNRRVVAPPGAFEPGMGQPIVVATVQRTGTHALIDLVLNNLTVYRRNPLYVDVDRLLGRLDEDRAIEEAARVIAGGAYVLKTHHPAMKSRPQLDAAFQTIAAAGVVVTTRRDVESTFRSVRRFIAEREHAIDPAAIASEASLAREMEQHQAFWEPFTAMTIDFDDLFDPALTTGHLDALGALVGVEPRRRHRPAPSKAHRRRVMGAKALTRLAGRRSPVLNTTVGFDQGAASPDPST